MKFNNWKRAAKQDSVASWKNLNRVMNAEEKPMVFNEWVAYINVQSKLMDSLNTPAPAAQAQESEIYQALRLEGFGIYNCDQIRRIQNPVEVFAMALTPDGQAKLSTTMFVIQKSKNMVFSYYNLNGVTKIAYGANAENKILAVAPDGSLSYTDEIEFTRKQQISESTYGFPSKEIATTPVSAQELREILFPSDKK